MLLLKSGGVNLEKRNAAGLTEKEFLAQYNPRNYEKPSVTVDMLILGMNKELEKLKVLLIQRKNHPCIECWALPGGFVDINESTDAAASRELEEETGLKNVYMEQFSIMSEPGRDPRMRVIDVAYVALMPVTEAKAGDDAADAVWFDITLDDSRLLLVSEEKNIRIEYKINKIITKNGVVQIEKSVPVADSEERLAFDHAQIILDGLLKIRSQIQDSDMAFNLVPQEFTLPDLQKVYETVLGKKLYKANFRKNIADKICSLDKKGTSIVGKRVSELYRYSVNGD